MHIASRFLAALYSSASRSRLCRGGVDAVSRTQWFGHWTRARSSRRNSVQRITIGESNCQARGIRRRSIAGDRVFLTCADEGTARRMIVVSQCGRWKDCVAARATKPPRFRQHGDNSYASVSPAVDGERVYVWWGAPAGSALVALDQKDGREVWKKDLGRSFRSTGPVPRPFSSRTPLLVYLRSGSAEKFPRILRRKNRCRTLETGTRRERHRARRRRASSKVENRRERED